MAGAERDAASAGRLVAALRARGVDYLAPSDAQGPPLDDRDLIAALAAHADPRLRQALIALFLVQPHLAPQVPSLQPELPEPAATELVAHYMAAVYLQSMWRTRLGHYQSPVVGLPDYFSQTLGLPHPDELYGKAGLYALADWHKRHAQRIGSRLEEYYNVADLLFGRLSQKAERVAAPARYTD